MGSVILKRDGWVDVDFKMKSAFIPSLIPLYSLCLETTLRLTVFIFFACVHACVFVCMCYWINQDRVTAVLCGLAVCVCRVLVLLCVVDHSRRLTLI